ncbi:hypothetical protein DM02DRAFT_149238 [Periconia macrospinosa]|uniref:Uncharacterized protein n=1 Tax=Periconia macrospinosa TaxID=97972 RepID=A0A2V1DBI4_9PLEO|nr:hypothetical protein DM02DRAFT_149238 [Periconia macrospinosa]
MVIAEIRQPLSHGCALSIKIEVGAVSEKSKATRIPIPLIKSNHFRHCDCAKLSSAGSSIGDSGQISLELNPSILLDLILTLCGRPLVFDNKRFEFLCLIPEDEVGSEQLRSTARDLGLGTSGMNFRRWEFEMKDCIPDSSGLTFQLSRDVPVFDELSSVPNKQVFDDFPDLINHLMNPRLFV